MAKKKQQGHYCKICGEIKANEKFSGKGHKIHICKTCQSLSKQEKEDMSCCQDIAKEILDEKIYHLDGVSEIDADTFDDTYIDNIPVFSEKKKFTELNKQEKTLLKNYIYSEIIEHWQLLGKRLNENELIEVKKRMIGVFEEECNIILKNDVTLRQFFHDNATSIINKMQKKSDNSQS